MSEPSGRRAISPSTKIPGVADMAKTVRRPAVGGQEGKMPRIRFLSWGNGKSEVERLDLKPLDGGSRIQRVRSTRSTFTPSAYGGGVGAAGGVGGGVAVAAGISSVTIEPVDVVTLTAVTLGPKLRVE